MIRERLMEGQRDSPVMIFNALHTTVFLIFVTIPSLNNAADALRKLN
jgi:hypothetical protein